MDKTTFEILKMDCPSEENLIRMKLDGISKIENLDFDIPNRKLDVFHQGDINAIEAALLELNLGSRLVGTESVEQADFGKNKSQKKLLWTVLIINFGFFALEIVTGLLSHSLGLIADSLDMLADSLVYGISLFAVGGSIVKKKKIATMSGYFQISLAVIGFSEVIRRFIGVEDMPEFRTMIIVSILALIANGFCLFLFQKSKSQEAHMKASMIFTSNDIIINLGVILAGVMVYLSNTNFPDLIVGAVVFVLVLRGAIRILKLGK